MSIIIWLAIHCYSFIRLRIIANDIFPLFFELLDHWTNIIYLSDDATAFSVKEYLAYPTLVEAVSRQRLQFFKNISQKIIDFPIFVKTFERHLGKLPWISQQDFAKDQLWFTKTSAKMQKLLRLWWP